MCTLCCTGATLQNSNLSPKDLSNEISSESYIVNDSDVVKISDFVIFDISFYPKDGGSISGDVWNAISFGNIVPKTNGSSLGIGRCGTNCFPVEFDFYTDGRTHLYAPSGVTYIRIHGMFRV